MRCVLCVTGEELAKLARIRYEQAKVHVAIARALVTYNVHAHVKRFDKKMFHYRFYNRQSDRMYMYVLTA